MNSIPKINLTLLHHYIAEQFHLITLLLEDQQLFKVQLQRVLLKTFPYNQIFYLTNLILKVLIWCSRRVKVGSLLPILKRIYLEEWIFKAKCLIKHQTKLSLHLDHLFLVLIDLIPLDKVTMKKALLIMKMMMIKQLREISDILKSLYATMILILNQVMNNLKLVYNLLNCQL